MIIVHILMQIRTPEMGKKALKHTYTKKPVDWKQTRKLLQSSWEILKLGEQANKLLISSHYVQPKLDNLLHFLIECKFCFFWLIFDFSCVFYFVRARHKDLLKRKSYLYTRAIQMPEFLPAF